MPKPLENAGASAVKPHGTGDFDIFQADIGKHEERQRLLSEVVERFGWIDLLVNNAGVAPRVRADILEAGEESFDRLISINLKGPYFLSQAVANFWLSRPSCTTRLGTPAPLEDF